MQGAGRKSHRDGVDAPPLIDRVSKVFAIENMAQVSITRFAAHFDSVTPARVVIE